MSLIREQIADVASIGVQDGSGPLGRGSGYKSNLLKAQTASYSFAQDGGAVGTILLRLPYPIPAGSVVKELIVNTTSALASDGAATVALGIVSSGDLRTAGAYNAAPYSASAPTVNTSPVLLSAEKTSIIMTVGTAAVTAGAFSASVIYLEGVATSV